MSEPSPAAEQAALVAWTETVSKVLGEVSEERVRQQIKWGEQNHPNGTGPDLWLSLDAAGYIRRHGIRRADLRDWMTGRTDDAFDHDVGTYEHILSEEWAEAIAESDPVKLRAELLQVAAVACAWVEKIDRDLAKSPTRQTCWSHGCARYPGIKSERYGGYLCAQHATHGPAIPPESRAT